jgi:hypothetical protein
MGWLASAQGLSVDAAVGAVAAGLASAGMGGSGTLGARDTPKLSTICAENLGGASLRNRSPGVQQGDHTHEPHSRPHPQRAFRWKFQQVIVTEVLDT